MKFSIFLTVGIALLVIMGVAVLHAQGVSSSIGVNGNVNASGLTASYYIHLIMAERWVEALNASGINSTSVIELINEAESYANAGNYLSAITTLNNAINLASQLMVGGHVNETQTILSDYTSLASTVNNTVVNNLLSNESLANFTLRILSVLGRYGNASHLVIMGMTILSNEERSLYSHVPPSAFLGLNTAVNILNMTFNEVMNAGFNSTVKQLIILKAEVMAISLLTPPNVRVHVLPQAVGQYLALLSENASVAAAQLSELLNMTISIPPQLMQCVGSINETLIPLVNESLSGPEVYALTNDFINNYTNCLWQVREFINEVNTTHAVITRFMGIAEELNNSGLSNLTPYLLNGYFQCRSKLINAFSSGNATLIRQVLDQCRYEVHNYENETYYTIWVMNLTRNYLSYVNSTIWSLAKQHGIGGVMPTLCYVKLNGNVIGNITLIIKEMLNGTITPVEAQTLINEYLGNITNSTPSLVAGCLGIPVGPHTYVPMINWTGPGNWTTIKYPSAVGELTINSNGSAELMINVTNPTQESLYISGFSIGGLACTFSSPVEVNANSQGTLRLDLAIGSNKVTSVTGLGASGDVVVSQGTNVNCIGYLPTMFMPSILNGELYLSNGMWITLFITVSAGTNTSLNYGWGSW